MNESTTITTDNCFTLDQLAWFDRCFFPADLESYIEMHGAKFGIDPRAACIFRMDMVAARRNGKSRGIIEMYQEYISDPAVTALLNEMVKDFLKK